MLQDYPNAMVDTTYFYIFEVIYIFLLNIFHKFAPITSADSERILLAATRAYNTPNDVNLLLKT